MARLKPGWGFEVLACCQAKADKAPVEISWETACHRLFRQQIFTELLSVPGSGAGSRRFDGEQARMVLLS